MKAYDIRAMSVEEVRQELQDAGENLANLRIQLRMNQLDDPLRIRHARRDVARLRTILREHELGLRQLAAAAIREEAGSVQAEERPGTGRRQEVEGAREA